MSKWPPQDRETPDDIFATTRWTMVLAAADQSRPHAQRALEELCRTYWFPLYAYVRRTGRSPHDAEDITQGFFARLLRLDSLSRVTPAKGKFRAFLLASLKNYLADEQAFARAQKRDARLTFSLDAQSAEQRYDAVPDTGLTPDQVFERQWAMTLLETVIERLAAQYDAAGRGELFSEIRFSIAGNSEPAGAEIAQRLGISEGSVRVEIHRLRQRYRAALREELAHTLDREEDVPEELSYLRSVLSR